MCDKFGHIFPLSEKKEETKLIYYLDKTSLPRKENKSLKD